MMRERRVGRGGRRCRQSQSMLCSRSGPRGRTSRGGTLREVVGEDCEGCRAYIPTTRDSRTVAASLRESTCSQNVSPSQVTPDPLNWLQLRRLRAGTCPCTVVMRHPLISCWSIGRAPIRRSVTLGQARKMPDRHERSGSRYARWAFRKSRPRNTVSGEVGYGSS